MRPVRYLCEQFFLHFAPLPSRGLECIASVQKHVCLVGWVPLSLYWGQPEQCKLKVKSKQLLQVQRLLSLIHTNMVTGNAGRVTCKYVHLMWSSESELLRPADFANM